MCYTFCSVSGKRPRLEERFFIGLSDGRGLARTSGPAGFIKELPEDVYEEIVVVNDSREGYQ